MVYGKIDGYNNSLIMADRNDFKLLKQRCIRHFELAKDYLGKKKLDLDDNQKARYGFYFFV